MHTALTLLSILAVLALGVMSPGPSFLLVARTAVCASRGAAVASALGMAAGATLLCMAALFGLHALFQQIPELFVLLKLVGGAYLLYLAVRIWRGAARPLAIRDAQDEAQTGLARNALIGIGTMLSNPKAAVQYGVIFAAMLPQSPSTTLLLLLPPAVFLLEASWYVFVAFGLSAEQPRRLYLSAKTGIDRTVGAVLAALGLKLLWASR
ncbi:MAG: LysE family transporter [Thiomonas sp.]|nr:LysE family transporter [Thiomonas sp.]